jgi:phosphomethylpyrimidine synthase
MRISQDVRDYAESQGLPLDAAVKTGLEEKAAEFRTGGTEVYREPTGP